ncbi:MAG: hypothetical protein NW204_10440 [Xanthomonadaceae bacterium]|jgi:hypothetical protein|nr:hypothetical protein [Xanthomonadaceae bacterium]
MLFVYLLFTALVAWVVFSDGAELLSEDLLPLLLPHLVHNAQRVRQVAGIAWAVFSLVGVTLGWL